MNMKHAKSLLWSSKNSFHQCDIKLCRVWRNCDYVCHTQWVGQQGKRCCWRLNEKLGQTTRLGHSEVEPSGTREEIFTTKASCQTLSLPSQCLSYTQVHNSIHAVSFSFHTQFTITNPPSVWGCVSLSPKHILSSLLFFPGCFVILLFYLCLFHCTFVSLLLRLFHCFRLSLLYL